MNCPYCGQEMELGLIHSPQEISWIKGGKRRTFARAEFHEGSLLLSKFSLSKGSAVAAFACKACQKIVIDYADEDSDLNHR